MTSAERKIMSEALLRRHGIRLNEHLLPIESDDEIEVRTSDEVLRRLVALWAVVGSAFLRDSSHFRECITRNGFESWLSQSEAAFLLNEERTERNYVKFTWKLECLYFLAWCAGLIDKIQLPTTESTVETIMHLFPRKFEHPDVLRKSVALHSKGEILNWADLLYRLHWAVRDAELAGNQMPPVNGGMVQEWHLAVNWITRYGDEDDWDHVGADT
jgi:hypothetical protein